MYKFATQINHDPFARTITYRKPVYYRTSQRDITCDWCGSHGKELKDGTSRLYRYGIYHDGINTLIEWEDLLFCCKSCRDSFNT